MILPSFPFRKLNLVKQAKIYVAKHEGELAERLAQSRSAKDILARYSLVFLRVSV